MTSRHPFKRAGTTWRVYGRTVIDGEERAVKLGGVAQTCGHYHAARGEAEACPWEPAIDPGTAYAGRVWEVRDDRDDLPRRARKADRPLRQREAPVASRQLGLFGGGA